MDDRIALCVLEETETLEAHDDDDDDDDDDDVADVEAPSAELEALDKHKGLPEPDALDKHKGLSEPDALDALEALDELDDDDAHKLLVNDLVRNCPLKNDIIISISLTVSNDGSFIDSHVNMILLCLAKKEM
jgi:hypothetical protein